MSPVSAQGPGKNRNYLISCASYSNMKHTRGSLPAWQQRARRSTVIGAGPGATGWALHARGRHRGSDYVVAVQPYRE